MNPLRKILAVVTVGIALFGPFLDGTANLDGWKIFPTVIAPAVMMMLIFILPLDITMARVFMNDANETTRAALKTAIKVDVFLLLVLILAWLPFFARFFEISFGANPN